MTRKIKKTLLLSKVEERFIYQLVVCVILCLIVIMSYLIINQNIVKVKFHEYNIVEDLRLINSIEDIQVDRGSIVLNGYAFMLERDKFGSTISVFLRSMHTEKEIWLDTEKINRPDVNDYFKCEYDYSDSGFIASDDLEKIKKDELYEIIINIDYIENNNKSGNKRSRKTVSTNRYLLNNELYAYNPYELDIQEKNIESDFLKEIFLDGQVCFYQKDAGIYIYQYDNKIYWVFTTDSEYIDDRAYIPYHIHTSQINKLPENRIQYQFDNMDFYFEDYEYKDEITTPYRVAVRDIPQEYAITYITTGIYDTEGQQWIIKKSFNLDNVIK